MSIIFDVTTSDGAYRFLLDNLGFQPDELILEYFVACSGNIDLFTERNSQRLDYLDIHDVKYIAFHVTGSLDDCREIEQTGIRDLQYVLSHDTVFSRMLGRSGIHFNIEGHKMIIDGNKFNIDYDRYKDCNLTDQEELLADVAHRIFYDSCVDGFWMNYNIEGYGTDIHKRPEFLSKLIELSPKANKLDTFWKAKSKPYKVFFYATADQIHKFTFGLEKNNEIYTEYEQEVVKKWMLSIAVDQAFSPRGEEYIYIRDHVHIPPDQIIRCELIDS